MSTAYPHPQPQIRVWDAVPAARVGAFPTGPGVFEAIGEPRPLRPPAVETQRSDRMTTHVESGWLQTYTGKKFHVMAPTPDEVDILDIAHALSNQCRYSGHTQVFYSVAEHAFRVSLEVPPQDALWGLLHDAAEAYVIDLPRHIKQWLRQNGHRFFDETEERVMRVVAEKYGLSWPQPESVDKADVLLLTTEARDLMSPLHPEWHYSEANGYPALAERIATLSPLAAEREFLRRFRELTQGGA